MSERYTLEAVFNAARPLVMKIAEAQKMWLMENKIVEEMDHNSVTLIALLMVSESFAQTMLTKGYPTEAIAECMRAADKLAPGLVMGTLPNRGGDA